MTGEDITYDWLVLTGNGNGYTDHVQHFKKLFDLMKVRGFLECGCGFSTKFFIDNCEHVTSIEFVNNGFGPEWMIECRELYKDCKNWTSVISEATPEIYKASCYQPVHKRDYEPVNPQYVGELRAILDNELSGGDFDVAFVDSGIYLRGDMVEQLLQANVPVVAAHDYGVDSAGTYGWGKIKSTDNYENIIIPFGQTTSFWIRKDLPNVIQGMKL